MLVTHTFLDKSNTIIEGSLANTGLNPVMSLYYGNMWTRILMHFDTEKLKSLVQEKVYPDITKLKHVLKLWNVSDIDLPRINCPFPDSKRRNARERATSFEVILFLIPQYWEAGRGFDYTDENPINGKASYSEYGSNWFYRTTEHKWRKPGIYTPEELINMPDEDNSVIVGRKRFDFGNEQFEMDVTDIVNKFIGGTAANYGLCLAFSPEFEMMIEDVSQYAGFFSNRTNTFFEPYLETTYDETIKDDRVNFFLNKKNKLFFYANVGGKSVNLDEMPTCAIDGTPMTVKQATKGAYYIDIEIDTDEMEPDTMFYDTWGNIKYQGKSYPDVELHTTTKSPENYLTFGLPFDTEKLPKFTPSLSGINDNEYIEQGSFRKINVDCKINYTTDQIYPFDQLKYRLYVIEADRQIDVIPWTDCDFMYNSACFHINTSELLPHEYHVDIKVTYDMDEAVHKNLLTFSVINNGRQPE